MPGKKDASAPFLFINYRKQDTVELADGLHIMLRETFGDVVFLDSNTLEKGAVFPPVLQQALDKATCMLVLIGQKWLFQHDSRTGERRLDQADDWVRREIERAFERSIDVIPVLAPGSELPEPNALPPSLRPLTDRIFVRLRAESYQEDRFTLVEDLIKNHGFVKRQRSRSETRNKSVTQGTSPPLLTNDAEALKRQTRPDGTKAWINGTKLHYYFFDGNPDEADIVRQAFQQWKDVGIGLEFEEVHNREGAEIRIGFKRGEGSWSLMGRDVLTVSADQRTMNFGWDLTHIGGLDTALKEIGHALSLANEHQNPHSGIVWNEEAVYNTLASPPNNWSREMTYHEIIKKGDPAQYYGPWDPNSIMHFPFGPGLILEPKEYRNGLLPEEGLSDGDRAKIRFLYKPLTEFQPTLVPMELAPLTIQPGEQANFTLVPPESRKYCFQTFGPCQVVMMLFEENGGKLTTCAADDNTGQHRNAEIQAELSTEKRYVLRVRLYVRLRDVALMMW